MSNSAIGIGGDAMQNQKRYTVSQERQVLYYVGMGLTVLGFLLFFSVFVTGALHFGNFEHFESRASSSMIRALSGMGLIVIGQILRGVGAKGLAGSGVILNPQQAREDLEPYSRMGGGMIRDSIEETGIKELIEDLGDHDADIAARVMVRCQQCRTLNEEDAKFCKECGSPM